jgi:hypothetical protein
VRPAPLTAKFNGTVKEIMEEVLLFKQEVLRVLMLAKKWRLSVSKSVCSLRSVFFHLEALLL